MSGVSEQLERGAEITKLARLLDVEPKELAYLEDIPAAALRAFRGQATDRLFGGDTDRLRRVAAASKLVPVPITVKVAQIAFGPVLCAATAGLLEPRHAVRVASRCPVGFLADITVNLDPRRAPEVIAAVPTPLVVDVAKELLERDEHVTIGRFVSFLSHETLGAAVPEIPDDADLLKVAFVMEGKESLDDVARLARDRFADLVRAAHEQDLWGEALDLIGHLSLELLTELGEVVAGQDDGLLADLIRAAHRVGAWDALLPVTAAMPAASLTRFATSPAVHDPDVLREIISVAARHELWDAVLPLADALPDHVKPRLAACIRDLTRDEVAAALEAAARSENLATLVEIALRQEPAGRQRVLEIVATLDRLEELAVLLTPDTPQLVWDALLEVRSEMPPAVLDVLHRRATDLGRPDVVTQLTPGSAARRPRPRPGR